MAPMIDLECPQCGSAFQRHPYYVRITARPFCSSSCYADHRRRGSVDAKGYVVSSRNGKFTKEHRRVVEAHIGRPLLTHEDVHHVDGDKSNNSIENLQVIDHREHSLQHNQRKVANHLGVSRQCMAQSLRRRGLL
jgi:hypothetical protein